MHNLLLIGGGGHSGVVAETALALDKYHLISHLDDNPKAELMGNKPIGQIKLIEDKKTLELYKNAFVAIGEAKMRVKLIDYVKKYKYNLATLIHPKATVSTSALIGEGTTVFAGSVIQANVRIGDGAIINTSSSIDHDCFISSGAHICPGVHLGGNVYIGKNTWIGIGSVIKQNCKVGSNVLIGAGSVVINDIEDNMVAFGVPAKPQNN